VSLEFPPVHVRLLRADEAPRLADAIRSVYGDSYDVPWVFDTSRVARWIASGLLVSCIAENDDGELLCHGAMSLRSSRDIVGHVGQAVTMPGARGRHLYTQVKRHLVYVARKRGLAGMYSEATAAHPYSQRANIDLGAHETGFLLGWIPATVVNNAVETESERRQSAALFYLRTNPKSARPAFAPASHREIVREIISTSRIHARLADPPRGLRLEARSSLHTKYNPTQNLVVITVSEPGADLAQRVGELRRRLFDAGVEAVYVDFPMDVAATALVAEHIESLGVSFAGVFPNSRSHGDVLRLQSLNAMKVNADDVAVASEHGRRLLDYVLADLVATGHAST